jgi:hypothetical protein
MCIDEVIDDFFKFAETPPYFERVININLLRQLRYELLDTLLHGNLRLTLVVVDQQLTGDFLDCLLNRMLTFHD